jgi:hypothetical protein
MKKKDREGGREKERERERKREREREREREEREKEGKRGSERVSETVENGETRDLLFLTCTPPQPESGQASGGISHHRYRAIQPRTQNGLS